MASVREGGSAGLSCKEVSLQELRQVIANGTPGHYSSSPQAGSDLESWSRQARVLELFAQTQGHWVRAHPTSQWNGLLVDLIVLKI